MSPEEMSRRLGVSPGAVVNWIRKGIVPARKEGRLYIVPDIAAESFIQRWKEWIGKPLPKIETPPPGLVRVGQAAEILGVCRRTMWLLHDRGVIKAYRVGKQLRYHPDDLRALLDAGWHKYSTDFNGRVA